MQRSSAGNPQGNFPLNDPEIAMVDFHQSSDNLLSLHPSNGPEESHISALRRVQLTVFRLITFSTLLGIGTAKAVQGWKGNAVSVTWVDWVGGTLFAAIWYYVSLFENLNPPVVTWFFHEDLSMDLFYLLSSILFIAITSFMAMFALWTLVLAVLYTINQTKALILDRGGWFIVFLLPWTVMLILVWLLLVGAELAIVYGIVILIRRCGNIAQRHRRLRLYYARAIDSYDTFNEGITARRMQYPALYGYVWIFSAAIALVVSYWVLLEFFGEWLEVLP